MRAKGVITIQVDGFPEQAPAGTTLAQLIERLSVQHQDLIVEHNGRFVYPRDYAKLRLNEGDRVEFILPAFGG
ncbi:MAG: sulfur carrier protein ThiS [Desulfarculus sp.]|jgi:thiamine biosynthesis protein ThiS|nr:MAG: sulfur carrier protein ThiS [Desulfarculus sp.]